MFVSNTQQYDRLTEVCYNCIDWLIQLCVCILFVFHSENLFSLPLASITISNSKLIINRDIVEILEEQACFCIDIHFEWFCFIAMTIHRKTLMHLPLF